MYYFNFLRVWFKKQGCNHGEKQPFQRLKSTQIFFFQQCISFILCFFVSYAYFFSLFQFILWGMESINDAFNKKIIVPVTVNLLIYLSILSRPLCVPKTVDKHPTTLLVCTIRLQQRLFWLLFAPRIAPFAITKGQLISKGLLGILKFFQKSSETIQS